MKLDRKFKIILISVLAVAILGGIIYLYRNQQIFHRVTSESGDIVYTVKPAKTNVFLRSGNDLIFADTSGLVSISKSGSVGARISANVSEPFVRAADKYLLLADRQGKDAYFIYNGKMRKHITVGNAIVGGNVNSEGNYILVTTEEGYRSCVTVYNLDGEVLYSWKVGDYYILDVALADNGNDLVAAVLAPDNNKISGGVAFVNIRKQSLTNLVKVDNNILSYVQCSGGDVIAIGTDKTLCFSDDGKQRWEIDYKGKKLQTFEAERRGDIALAFKTGTNTSLVEIYSSKGKLKGSCSLDYDVINLDIRPNKVLAVGSKTISEITHRGILRTTINMENEVKYGALCGGNKIFFTTGTNVKIMNP